MKQLGRRCPNKHKNSWVIASGNYLWCPDCGALRSLCEGYGTWKRWLYPDGHEKTIERYDNIK